MKRTLALAATVAAALVASLAAPAGSTPAATQDNVRHVRNVPGSTGGHVAIEGNRMYVGAYGLGMRIFDISDPANPTQIGQYFPGPQSSSDPGLRADAVPDAAVFDGKHIATLNGTGRTSGTQQTEFLDVTDPEDPLLLHRFTGATEGEAHNGDIVDSRGLWLPSGGRGDNGFRIYDLSPLLQNPPAAPAELFRGNPHTLWRNSPHKGEEPAGDAFDHTHDITVYPDYPVLLPQAQWTDQDGDGVADPTTAPRDIALLAGANPYALQGPGANTGAMYVIDISDPANPVVLEKWQNPSGEGSHPIRYLHEAQFIDGIPGLIGIVDEDLHNGCNAGRMYFIRISEDLQTASKLSEWAIGSASPTSAVCGSHVFSSHDGYVFNGAYQAGLQVIDVSDPADPKRAGQYVAEGMDSWGAQYHKGYIYVGDLGPRGLDVFQFLANPVAKGLIKAPNPTVTTVPGATETLSGCDPDHPSNGADGLIVPIPADKRDGTHILRATGNADAAYDLNVYWYDANCVFISGASLNSENPDEEGFIPEEAATGFIDLVTGPPTFAYAQIDPPF